MHGEIMIGDSVLMLNDHFPEFATRKEELTPEQMGKRAPKLFGGGAPASSG